MDAQGTRARKLQLLAPAKATPNPVFQLRAVKAASRKAASK